ncbi:hypothetical protein Pryu01_00525 [Paraliobacillus ryukyuensis]|uniref:Uncharacterized protein DUF2759 n=1 Tax=Paraliobacillus ryukyuensis TaxID=200904 RepID=A0A366EGE7_9BACI|nr:DUF2759 family protein [Paraliobacillus ryukyuensis]RBP01403.1 uncharacterized protein DUF2759 [Paraliobacillus ryukyuensis]
MALAIILIIITSLSSLAVCREIKSKNISAAIVTGSSAIIFGFFSITTVVTSILS